MFQTNVVQKIKICISYSITFFLKSCRLWDNVEKYGEARRATDDSNTYCFSTTIMVSRTRLNVTLYYTASFVNFKFNFFSVPHSRHSSLTHKAKQICLYYTITVTTLITTDWWQVPSSDVILFCTLPVLSHTAPQPPLLPSSGATYLMDPLLLATLSLRPLTDISRDPLLIATLSLGPIDWHKQRPLINSYSVTGPHWLTQTDTPY
jgi:hypothetical protein